MELGAPIKLNTKSYLVANYYWSLRFFACLTAGAGFFSLGSGCLPVSSEVSISLISGISLPICGAEHDSYNTIVLCYT